MEEKTMYYYCNCAGVITTSWEFANLLFLGSFNRPLLKLNLNESWIEIDIFVLIYKWTIQQSWATINTINRWTWKVLLLESFKIIFRYKNTKNIEKTLSFLPLLLLKHNDNLIYFKNHLLNSKSKRTRW